MKNHKLVEKIVAEKDPVGLKGNKIEIIIDNVNIVISLSRKYFEFFK